jgi:geranylgeranyl pyrophosphate synthase
MPTGRESVADPFMCVPVIEAHLASVLRRTDLPRELVEAMRYALLGGGKRLRPVLAWHACVAAGGPGETSLDAGAAVELVHAFSLAHDDLPAMDDDDLRRGKPTLHIHAGEAMAILAGDAMMSLAFQLLASSVADAGLSAALVRDLSDATTRMISGQVYDTLSATDGGDRARLELIHRNKTAALIRAACVMGARCGAGLSRPGEHAAMLGAITRYGEDVGLMFQVVDDLLDVEMTSEQTGKRTRKDADAGKLTYPRLLGVEASRREVERLRVAAKTAVEPLGPAAGGLAALCDAMAARRR